MKRLAILGSTGSIGQQTLETVRAYPDRFQVAGLAAGRHSALFDEQIAEFSPAYLSVAERSPAERDGLPWLDIEDLARQPDVDVVVVGIPGVASLGPTLAAVSAGKAVALASKEALVVAGALVMAEAARTGGRILPVDSEHSAIWQCIRGEEQSRVRRLILTASGGPLRGLTQEEISRVTPEQALQHPTWIMGPKVTIDSATLMNKGLETIEAHWLYEMPYDAIDVVVHPQSIIHSLVEFADGSCKAQLGYPDMRLPVQYALAYPERWPADYFKPLDLVELGTLTFEALDTERFPCYALARLAGERGGTYPAVLQAADEVAVELFLAGHLPLSLIAGVVEEALAHHDPVQQPTLDDLLAADAWARRWAYQRSGVPQA